MLRTKCTGCIFQNGASCDIGNATIIDNSTLVPFMVMNGYCNIKRNKKWNGYSPRDNTWTHYKKVIGEEQIITIMLIISPQTYDSSLSFIKSFNRDSIGRILIGAMGLNADQVKFLIETLKALEIKWRLEDIKSTEIVENSYVVDYLMQFAETSWVLVGENLSETMHTLLRVFSDDLGVTNHSLVAFINDNDMLVNRFAFLELGGNSEISFLEKVKELDKDGICLKKI